MLYSIKKGKTNFMRYALLLFISLILSACHELFDAYENPNQPYNRQQTCQALSELLREYDSPKDYKNKPISRARLAKYYNDYKLYGCEK
jgi:hypothetical protein